MESEQRPVDTTNNDEVKPPGPLVSLMLSYPAQPTLEQRLTRLERLVTTFIILACFMALACLGMIWAFLTAFKVI